MYPEDLEKIHNDLNVDAKAKLPALNDSTAAEWKIWTGIFAIAIRAIQALISQYLAVVDQKLTTLRPGTVGWYAEIAKKFQTGSNLMVLADGTLGYLDDSPSLRIIEKVSVVETAEGGLSIKVAKLSGFDLVPLTEDELTDFQEYMESVKFAGTQLFITSTDADNLTYDIQIYYDLSYSSFVVEQNVIAAIDAFRSKVDFDGVIYRQRFITNIMSVDGVVTLSLNDLIVTDSSDIATSVVNKHTPDSGHFNVDHAGSILVVSPINDL